MTNGVVCKVLASHDWLESLVNLSEVWLEEGWFNFSKLVKFDESIFEDCLVVISERLRDHCNHKRK